MFLVYAGFLGDCLCVLAGCMLLLLAQVESPDQLPFYIYIYDLNTILEIIMNRLKNYLQTTLIIHINIIRYYIC